MTERKPRTSKQNQRFVLKRRKPSHAGNAPGERDTDGPQWIYGLHAASAVLANPLRSPIRIVATANASRQIAGERAPEILKPHDIDRLLPDGAVHQGIAVLVDPLEQPMLQDILTASGAAPLVFLDHVTDPHNVGAILRSASAFGAAAVVTTKRNSAPVTGVLAKAASGALEHIPYLQTRNLAAAMDEARQFGYRLLGLDEAGARPLAEELAGFDRIALVFGAEGSGLRDKTKQTCDALAHLPTTGPVGALNVSNAVAVSLYAFCSGRSREPDTGNT